MVLKSSVATFSAKLLGAAALFATCLAAVAADPFPSKEIRFIVPWNAGGSNDISARALSQIAAEEGVKVIVENVPGATGAIGANCSLRSGVRPCAISASVELVPMPMV